MSKNCMCIVCEALYQLHTVLYLSMFLKLSVELETPMMAYILTGLFLIENLVFKYLMFRT